MSQTIRFFLNGQKQEASVRPDTTVLDWLRSGPRLTGTKEGCAEGDCGACSVLIGDPRSTLQQARGEDDGDGEVQYQAANSCILAMGQIDGRALVTVEGLKSEHLHPVQAAMAENGSSQCGFCTPGIVISLAGLAARKSAAGAGLAARKSAAGAGLAAGKSAAEPEIAASGPATMAEVNDADIHDALAGNLCRCTGYRPIVEAARKAGITAIDGPHAAAFAKIEPRKTISASGSTFHQPQTLNDLLELRQEKPGAILLGGGTDLGVALADYHSDWDEVISLAHVRELRAIRETENHLSFGAAVTWEEILSSIADYYPSFATLIRRFGSTQIRSMGTIGGNIGTASPIGDGPPALIALGAEVELASSSGHRFMALEDFFLDYRKTELRNDEVIASVSIPKPVEGQEFRVYKISKRYDQDISTVCGAFSIIREEGQVRSARIAFGGMAATPQRAARAELALVGTNFDQNAIEACAAAITARFQPLSDWRGSAEYRLRVAANLAERFWRDVNGETVEVIAL
ncbi:xanthine dehydrogenase small subunit [Phyllobacterium endophyticum]|uniref:Xanthine dehydrogenase small subunit n=1 Tax=Phyllobacterium endophyticum TaxID=1149773 RepID=A0A2P7B1N9_9HYPH|nr:xanthine dehydrogenase small subunit [Phyllobacterium endophyticum]MBB3237965.1 xanthine dehydrogenase small subunit [Phyllobacterium endophyticum]PSH60389.1 xanthine dehydrogenase small subunit [Phyllobacterium endophyticum]TYR42566.1 xanthine dehydrogenase small subunit [Phyllobacterium endophyticum]